MTYPRGQLFKPRWKRIYRMRVARAQAFRKHFGNDIQMRARTSHTYDSKVALQVAAAIPALLEEAEYLHAELQRRLS